MKYAKKISMMPVYIGMGSNIGNREENLRTACKRIIAIRGIQMMRCSRFYETAPIGGPLQPMFLNAVLGIKTVISPHKLLEQFQGIEILMGRTRTVKWGPRTIDIDILIYGDKIVDDDRLKIPHSLMHTRLFVLEPFVEIAPNVVHPGLQKTILHLYRELQTSLSVTA
ncbi:MAG: 2-amino-4-hydroxy-6-hydroxymethyldihydropteridine diphosphokinase [Candidatus Brocadia sp. BROELEC01]|nr:2-amino-4-hydroxy-6-hydroxymethyldihydropteridine diphosphokinase [Candidatus Brocadia sapporoensis]RZV58640.1 MAG: 2-amino-4-hydroxy-6-hydroxymethyldihydropteridine diphosphokinase [Candidatus Brocadia sp. BROELEC01]